MALKHTLVTRLPQRVCRYVADHLQTPASRCLSSSPITSPGDLHGVTIPEYRTTYNKRDVILYALGVGMSVEHKDSLRFLYENHPKFSVLPSFGAMAINGLTSLMLSGNFPLKLSMDKVLHGEQYVEMKGPVPTSGVLINKPFLVDVLDKGKGTILAIGVNSYTEDGRCVYYTENTVYTSQYRAWGGPTRSDKLTRCMPTPDRPCDTQIQQKTDASQAALYRLSGDLNPLHIDPEFSKLGGFPVPILHGICSLGFSSRHVLQQYCDNDPTRFQAMKVRFSHPVLPGQTLCTEMWHEHPNVHFQTKVVETGAVCLSGGHIAID